MDNGRNQGMAEGRKELWNGGRKEGRQAGERAPKHNKIGEKKARTG